MAVSTTNAYDGPFSANGVTQSFPFTFTAQSAGDKVSDTKQEIRVALAMVMANWR